MGFDLVWNAFEGRESGYTKQKGRPLHALYDELKSVGCSQLTSMIIGFPYQDEPTIWSEFESLMALEPALTQCLIYFAFPGTPFHSQVIREKRYLPQFEQQPDLRRWDGFAMHFKHPKFDRPEMVEEIQHRIYQRDFERLGPSVMRLARVWLTGHLNLRNDPSPLLQQRAQRLGRDVRSVLPALAAVIAFPPSSDVRDRARRLRSDIIRHTGEPTVRERAMAAAAPAMYLASRAARSLGVFQQPGVLRTEHRTEHAAASQHTRHAMRLQGGAAAGGLGLLWQDALESVRARLRHARQPAGDTPLQAATITQDECALPGSLVPAPRQ
mgnify:FL=1